MRYMLVCHYDDGSVNVRFSDTEIFGPPFTKEESDTFSRVRLYERLGDTHKWLLLVHWNYDLETEQYETTYQKTN